MNHRKMYPVYFIIPIFLIFFIFSFLPGITAIGYSFTNWNSFSSDVKWVGLDNFKEIFTGNPQHIKYIVNTLIFTLFTTLLKTLFGFLLALLMTSGIKGKGIYRMIVFSPQVMSYLIVSLVFRAMLHPSTGFLNNFLKGIGLDFLAMRWLTDLRFAFPTVMAVDIWKGVGYIMILIIAGMQAIPETYYEASSIDGASGWHKIKYITIPLLVPVLINCTVLNITYGFRVFDIVYALTGGGPGHATSVISTAVFKFYSDGNYGMANALSSILFVTLLSLSYFIIRAMEGKGLEQA